MEQKVAVVFPGQGSQSIGMLSKFAAEKQVLETFEVASHTLGYNLWTLIEKGPLEKLNKTEFAQPALLAAGVACFRFFQSRTPCLPHFLAGHSLGEYTALVCAEALKFEEGLRLVAKRGELMQKAVPSGEGTMAVILGLSDIEVETICAASAKGEIVSAANYNAPGQVVIAGNINAVNRAIERAKAHGAKRVVPLSVSVPSHCLLMQSISEEFAGVLNECSFSIPRFPVLHNVDIQTHQQPEEIRQALKEQLYQPVRWFETVQKMAQSGIECIFECGPGNILTGLNKRIVPTLQCISISMEHSLCL